jgi:hypothetical protein
MQMINCKIDEKQAKIALSGSCELLSDFSIIEPVITTNHMKGLCVDLL